MFQRLLGHLGCWAADLCDKSLSGIEQALQRGSELNTPPSPCPSPSLSCVHIALCVSMCMCVYWCVCPFGVISQALSKAYKSTHFVLQVRKPKLAFPFQNSAIAWNCLDPLSPIFLESQTLLFCRVIYLLFQFGAVTQGSLKSKDF